MNDEITLDVRLAKEIGMEIDEQWSGVALIRGQAEGALPIGTIVEKCNSEEGDSYPDGTRGLILSSHFVEEEGLAYFVVFAVDHPLPVLIRARRVKELLRPPQAQG